jgi:FPC/CPF motif-containing protein YcgG
MNPFSERGNPPVGSCYLKPDTAKPAQLLDVATGIRTKSKLIEHVHNHLRAMLSGPSYPCVLGRGAINRNNYRFGFYQSIEDASSILGLCYDLCTFVNEQDALGQDDSFSTFMACFLEPIPRTEQEFELALWQLLQKSHDEDCKHFDWDSTTSSDPGDRQFSFSFAERSYFVIGLHPHSSRYSRRFIHPTVVFNAHYQFEKLRVDGKFDSFQKAIRENDIKLQGNINPSLTTYGQDSEAKQYSGRLVEPGWKCPFNPFRSGT